MKKDIIKLLKFFIGGVIAGAICIFIIKLYFGTHWDWDSDDLNSLIVFGTAGWFFQIPLKK